MKVKFNFNFCSPSCFWDYIIFRTTLILFVIFGSKLAKELGRLTFNQWQINPTWPRGEPIVIGVFHRNVLPSQIRANAQGRRMKCGFVFSSLKKTKRSTARNVNRANEGKWTVNRCITRPIDSVLLIWPPSYLRILVWQLWTSAQLLIALWDANVSTFIYPVMTSIKWIPHVNKAFVSVNQNLFGKLIKWRCILKLFFY